MKETHRRSITMMSSLKYISSGKLGNMVVERREVLLCPHPPPSTRTAEPVFSTFMEPRNRFQGMNSASLCSVAGRYDNPIPTRFLAPIDCLKIPAQACGRYVKTTWTGAPPSRVVASWERCTESELFLGFVWRHCLTSHLTQLFAVVYFAKTANLSTTSFTIFIFFVHTTSWRIHEDVKLWTMEQ